MKTSAGTGARAPDRCPARTSRRIGFRTIQDILEQAQGEISSFPGCFRCRGYPLTPPTTSKGAHATRDSSRRIFFEIRICRILVEIVIFLKNTLFWKISQFRFRVAWGHSGPSESIAMMALTCAECRRTLLGPCGPMPRLPLPPSGRPGHTRGS